MQKFISVMVTLFALVQPAFSQFSYDKIKDDAGVEFEKPVKFYWTPHYNRVEGIFLNFGARIRPVKIPAFQFYGDAGVGFWNDKNKEFRFNAGARKDFFDFNRLSVGFDVFKKLDSEDDWVVGDVENSLSSLLFREDYRDYYGVLGFRVYADKKFLENHTARIELERRTYDALDRNINWSVFKGNFDENPKLPQSAIIEGDELGVKLVLALDWRDNPVFPLTGWYVEGIFEHTGEDFSTDGLFLSVKRFQQVFGSHRLLIRALLGTRHGSIAEQHLVDLGGIGSLRAFDDKEFSGNRMFLLNVNYLFGDLLQKLPFERLPVFGAFWATLSLGVFFDAGMATATDVNDGLFSGFSDTFDNLKADFGASLLVLDGVLRMDVARRTSSTPGKDDYRITFRLLENF